MIPSTSLEFFVPMIRFRPYIWLFCLFSLLGPLEAAKEKIRKFRLGGAMVSSKLSHGKQDTTVFLSFDFLEKLLAEELLKAGVEPLNDEGVKFVEFKGTHMIIRGSTGILPFEIDVNGEFYQKPSKKPSNNVYMDFSITFTKAKGGFLDSLLDLVTLPVGMIFESVLNVIFATTDLQADVKDFFKIDVSGKLNPFSFLSRLGASFVNLFRPSGDKIRQMHEGEIKIEFSERALIVLNKAKNVEVGAIKDGILVYFY